MTDRFGEQTVFGGNLIESRRHKRLDKELRARGNAAFHAGDDNIEIVESAKRSLANNSTLRRVRIDIVEMRKTVWIFHVAEQRQAVLPVFGLGMCIRQKRISADAQDRHRKAGDTNAQNGAAAQTHAIAPMRNRQ